MDTKKNMIFSGVSESETIKEIEPKIIEEIIASKGFDYDLIIKDYYITLILYLMRDLKDMYFKGGTALQKTLLDYSRISEDIDFTLQKDVGKVKKEIKDVISKSKMFGEISQDKSVHQFTRMIVHYDTKLGKGRIFIDLNERANLILEPQKQNMKHFYPNIPRFEFSTLSKEEMIAEKIAAAIGRNKPRDHYDIYQIIKHGLPIDMALVRKKCKNSGNDPSILKMFNKAKKLKNRWDEDLLPLLVEEISFKEVIQTLAKHFKLKHEKEKLKSQKPMEQH